MQEKEFDLLTQPWVMVNTHSLEQREVSLTDAMIHAHEYVGLSGETPTQDAAMLRVLLAIALTVFYRYDEDGNEDELSEENDSDDQMVLERWEGYWEKGRFPAEAVEKYLQSYSERFWLFHPETPFWQVKDLAYGTEYGVGSLVGNLKESNNPTTRHHFSMKEGETLDRLSYAEAARWVVFLNAYGVNVKKDKNAPGPKLSVGTGRMGQLGFVMVNGDNLFRILMLNLCPLNDESNLWKKPKPIWEQDVHIEQGCKISKPDNLPERYTMQSRRITLKRENGFVIGFRAIGGDFFSTEDDFTEPMTLWREGKSDKKAENLIHIPKLHTPSIQVWEEFPALTCEEHSEHIPGIVLWIKELKDAKILGSKDWVTFRMIGLEYGDQMKYTYGDSIDNTLTMSSELFAEMGAVWRTRISDEVTKCQNVAAKPISHFSSNMGRLFGGNNIKELLVSDYYSHINAAFHEWLVGIDPKQDECEHKIMQWEQKSYRYARQTVEDYIRIRNIDIFASKEEDGKILTVPGALNMYLGELRKIYQDMQNHTERSSDEYTIGD